MGGFLFVSFDLIDDERDDFVKIADDPQISKFEDARFPVHIDGDDQLGTFYPICKFICA